MCHIVYGRKTVDDMNHTGALFYLTIRIALYSDCFMKQQAAQHLLHSNLLRLRVCKVSVEWMRCKPKFLDWGNITI